jgi:hypothetical protein
VYDVDLLERVGVDIELPTIFHAIGWKKLYEVPCSGSHLLTLEFLITFDSFTQGKKSFVHFHLFGRELKVEFSRFSELMDFSSSCLLEGKTMKNFSRIEFYVEISENPTRIRFSDIHNPTPRFMHRWVSFTLFLTWELRSVTVAEFRCLYAMAHKIRYSLVADIVDYFNEIRTLSGPVECTSLDTQIALNLGCAEMSHVSYIEGDVPILGLTHFVHTHILREEPNSSISMLYERASKVIQLPNPTLPLYSCKQLTLQLA